MKKLIKAALQEAFTLLEKQLPRTKLTCKSQSVGGMTLAEITETYPDIPRGASFEWNQDGTVTLEWVSSVPLSEDDILKFKKKRFPAIAWNRVYHTLIANGYRRIGVNSSLLRQFEGICFYNMFLLDNIDFFEKYYSLHFVKVMNE